MACKDKVDTPAAQPTSAADLDKRCDQLGKVCGDNAKHIEKIVEGCKQAAKQVVNGCTDQAIAMYACYERAVCGMGDNVWTIEDLGVLAERHSKCVAERNASRDCVKK
jgi:hypothetical protein